jgi:hypothetical protein
MKKDRRKISTITRKGDLFLISIIKLIKLMTFYLVYELNLRMVRNVFHYTLIILITV